jgi:hypothetical protein
MHIFALLKGRIENSRGVSGATAGGEANPRSGVYALASGAGAVPELPAEGAGGPWSLYIGIRRRRRRGSNSLGWSAVARRATPGI